MKHTILRLARSLAALVLAVLAARGASAQLAIEAPPAAGPPAQLVICSHLELQRQVPCPDSTLFFHEGESFVERAYQSRDYHRLDELYAAWCRGSERFPDGRWKLISFRNALEKTFTVWNAWNQDLKILEGWRQARPQSPAAPFAEAVYWYAYAWNARGTGYAGTVSKEAWALYRERILKAKEALDAALPHADACPATHELLLHMLTEVRAPETELRSAFERGVRAGAEYQPIYFAMARHYEPRWGGSAAAYERFAREVARRTESFEGMGMYARLYWVVDQRGNLPFLGGESRVPPAWKDLHAGYEDLMRRYPSSMHNLGRYLGLACRSADSALYRRLRGQIGVYADGAQMEESVDVCDRRHRYVPPAPAK